jgi:hypothetical protein
MAIWRDKVAFQVFFKFNGISNPSSVFLLKNFFFSFFYNFRVHFPYEGGNGYEISRW